MTRRPPTSHLLALGGLYASMSYAAVSQTRFDGGVAFIWIASAVLIGYLAFSPRRHWPVAAAACFLPGLVVTSSVGLGWAAAIPLGLANVGEAALVAALLRRQRDRAPIESLRWLVGFIAAAGVLGPLASSMVAAAVIRLATGMPVWSNALHWYTGHALGNLTFAPIVMLATSGELRRWIASAAPRRQAETAALLALVAAVSLVAFSQQNGLPLLFLPLLPVILATFRAGRFAAASSIVIVALIGGTATLTGHGPISVVDGSTGMKIQFLQFYLACTTLTILPITADLARRQQLFRQLRDSEARYRILAEHSTDIIMNLDTDGRIRFVSPSIRALGGFEPAQLVGRPALQLIAPEYAGAVIDAHRAALAAGGEPVRVEYQGLTRDGERRWFETHTRAVMDESGEPDGVISAIREVGARKRLEQQLSAAAMTDPLTGLANRRAFTEALEAQLAAGRHGCVALFDLDHFKRVNDTHGHAAGDLVLGRFARLAEQAVRGGDTVARIGGEEFAILLSGASTDQASMVCERLRRSVARDVVPVDGGSVRVTVSGGVAPIGGGSAPDILAAADAALYHAKRAGRDRLTMAA